MDSAKKARKPEWLKIRLETNENYQALKGMMRAKRLHTVCEEAKCPNIYECWSARKTATFMILGDICTRACRFCAVKSGKPGNLNPDEPFEVADSVFKMGLRHVVITAVARDDLPDYGADHYAKTVRAVRERNPECAIEVLPSDMGGALASLKMLLAAKPDVLNHNVETVRRLTSFVRSRSDYDRSLEFLRRGKDIEPGIVTKSNIMVGLGETEEEIFQTMRDLRENHVDLLTIGQYLAPSKRHLKVEKYWHPDDFARFKQIALEMGFKHCQSGPLVRSSYHADEQLIAKA